jgi:hypothetical protein
MIAITTEANACHGKRTSIPFPWYAIYELGRQICVGCAVTFGPRPVSQLSREHKMKNDVLRIKLVLINEAEETVPVTRELPKVAFEPHALVSRIADAFVEGVATGAAVGSRTRR